MGNPNDVAIDIPLNSISSGQTGARTSNNQSASYTGNEAPLDYSTTPTDSSNLNGHGPGRRKRTLEGTGNSEDEPQDGTLTRLGRFYQAVLNFSIATRYFIYAAPLAILIAIPIIVGATAARYAKIGGVPIYWFFTWIEVVWLSLWVAKIVAHFIPYVFQFLCGIVSSGTRKYALVLRSLETPIALLLWSVVSLVTLLPIMAYNPVTKDEDVRNWQRSIKNILFALLVLSIIYLAEKALVRLISISYHRKQFDAKIKQSKRNVDLLGYLYEASRNMFPLNCKEFRHDDAIISDTIFGAAARKGPRAAAMPLKFIQNVGGKVSSAFGNVAQELTGKQVFNSNSPRAIVAQALERKKSAEALARRIWMSFVAEGRESLCLEDIIEVFGKDREAEAQECFEVLDRDENGDIGLDEMVLTLAEFSRHRKTLNHSVHDVDQAIDVLDNLLMGVAGIVGALVFISFVTSGFGTVIAACATTLLSLSFIFAATAAEVLGSCIFLFVKHPFDIGDRVEIADKPYIVERISLLYTVFRNVSDHRISQISNSVLNTTWIDNFTRANAMREQLSIQVSFDTTFANIQMLREELEKFVRDKENCRDFMPDINIEVLGVGAVDKLELRVDIQHKSNWAIEHIRAARRSKFMCALLLAVRKIPMRAPGAEAPAEESTDGKPDSDDKDNNNNNNNNNNSKREEPSSAQEANRLLASATAAPMMTEAKSSALDLGHQGSIQHRGSSTSAAAASSASPGFDEKTNPTTSTEKPLALNPGVQDLAREPSITGVRKSGETAARADAASSVGIGTGTVAENIPPPATATVPAIQRQSYERSQSQSPYLQGYPLPQPQSQSYPQQQQQQQSYPQQPPYPPQPGYLQQQQYPPQQPSYPNQYQQSYLPHPIQYDEDEPFGLSTTEGIGQIPAQSMTAQSQSQSQSPLPPPAAGVRPSDSRAATYEPQRGNPNSF